MGMAKSSTTAIATSKCITIMVSIFTQRIDNGPARISILLVDPTSIRYSNSLMLEAVSRVVGFDMYNEMVDSISLEKLDKICHALDCDVGDILVVETDQLRRTLADKPRK